MPDDQPALDLKLVTLGRLNYEAFHASRGWRIAVGGPFPPWGDQRHGLAQAWEDAARAVASRPRALGDVLNDIVSCFNAAKQGPFWTTELENGLRHLQAVIVAVKAHHERINRLSVPEGPQG